TANEGILPSRTLSFAAKAVESRIAERTEVEDFDPCSRDARSDQRDAVGDREIQVLALPHPGTEGGLEAGGELWRDLVAASADGRADRGEEVLLPRPCADETLHRALHHAGDGSPPARMHRRHPTRPRIGQEDGNAVGG